MLYSKSLAKSKELILHSHPVAKIITPFNDEGIVNVVDLFVC